MINTATFCNANKQLTGQHLRQYWLSWNKHFIPIHFVSEIKTQNQHIVTEILKFDQKVAIKCALL